MLKSQRQVAAAVAAPGAGTGGQNMDIALVLADGSNSGKADPAYDAHMMPIGEWALACWENWTTDAAMELMVRSAKLMVKEARNQWARVYGPAAAMVMTCLRLGWEVVSARYLVTHEGETLDLKVDPPAVVLQRVVEAVKRWRWLRIEKACPQLAANGAGRGALMEPLWQLLNTKTKDAGWNEQHKAGLKSAAAGRQFTQARVKLCGWAKHDRCTACLNHIVEQETPHNGSRKRTVRDTVAATEAQLAKAPVGNLNHRLWSGDCLAPLRKEKARGEDLAVARNCNIQGHPAWERGLEVRPPMPKRRQSQIETLNWHVKPVSVPVIGQVYPDGSYLDGLVPETGRCGWAFVIIGTEGEVVAAAYGVPPPWIKDIGGAEAWALYQSLLVTIPIQCRYWPDCLPVHIAVQKGIGIACDPKNVLARVHSLMLTALDDSPPEVVGWMPSHLTLEDLDLQMARKSDGTLVTKQDLEANDLADKLAKKGVEYHRVSRAEMRHWALKIERAKDRARWIGVATHEANNRPDFPFSDSEAARWRAEAAQRAKANAKSGTDGRKKRAVQGKRLVVDPSNGGHTVSRAATGQGWICTVCRIRSVKKWRLTSTKCSGSTKKTWTRGPCGLHEVKDGGKEHVLLKSGTVLWCCTCGAFAESRADRLRSSCRGPPPQSLGTGGVRSQLNRLRASLHPVTRERLPQATRADGKPVHSVFGYARRQGVVEVDRHFTIYEPEDFPKVVRDAEGKSACSKRRLLIGRVKCRIASSLRLTRKLRMKECRREAAELITSFLNGEAEFWHEAIKVARKDAEKHPTDGPNHPCLGPSVGALGLAHPLSGGDDCVTDEAEFWHNLVADISTPVKPDRLGRTEGKPSRLARLTASQVHTG